MSRSVQRRRGTTAEHATFTGALAELTVDTTKDTVVVHDGAVAGGYPLLRQDLSNLPAGTIDNADINASAAIVDTKLATIATAGKVSNSATTATNANTASAIVARDASGNFSAGTITAAVTGAASSNVLKAGDTMTGALVVPLASAATPSLTFTGDLNTGIHSPGADQLAVSTGGVQRVSIDSAGKVSLTGDIEFSRTNPAAITVNDNGVITLSADSANTAAASSINMNVDGLEVADFTNAGYLRFNKDNFAGAGICTQQSDNALSLGGGANTLNTGLNIALAGPDRVSNYGYLMRWNTTNLYQWDKTSDFHAWNTGGSERLRIDSSGRLLVGTSSARTGVFYNGDANAIPRLQIEAAGTGASSSASAAIGIVRNSDVAGAQPYLAFARTRGTTLGSASVVSSGDGIGTISFQSADGTDFVEAASITAQVDGTPGANDMPGRIVLSTTASGAFSPTERVRLTNTGALLVGTTTTPTGAGSGAVVAEDRMVISSINAGRHQVIAGDIGTMTATTGTVVFKFTAQATTPRSCYVKLAIANRGNNNTPSNLPAAEYAFQLHRTTAGVCSLNGATTVFEFTYVYATHVAFADLGSGECTVTLTNPTVLTQIGSYKVEVLTAEGIWTLDSVTTT
jgi:hypothetical protein